MEVSYFPGRDSSLHVAGLRAKAVALAELTARSVAPALEFEDEAVLAEFLEGVARDSDVAWVAACSKEGKLLSARGQSRTRSRCSSASSTQVALADGSLDVSSPIIAKTHPGTLVVSFRTASIRAAHDYLPKPVRLEALRSMVEKWLDASRPDASAPRSHERAQLDGSMP